MRTSGFRVGGAALAALAAFFLGGCEQKNEFIPPPPPEVTVAHPVMREIADTMEFVGRTRATATVDLRARVNGYLEKIDFPDGADVSLGDQLFQIEQAPYIATVDSAKAALQKAQAELQLAQSQYRRLEPLVAQRAITTDELEIQAAQVATSNANVAAAAAALRTAELDLQYTTIRAPIAGHIGQHLVDIGNLVQAQQTLLATIQSIDPIYADFDVNERDLLRFMAMLRKRELPDPVKNPPVLRLGLENEANFPHQGTLDFRELGVDPGTGTTRRRGVFPNPNREILPGMSVRIRAQIGATASRLMVEERAIGADQRGDFLLVVNDKNVVEYRPVRLGIAVDGMRVVEEGVKIEDWVVINGLQRARPGAEVRPVQTEMGAAATLAGPPAPSNSNGDQADSTTPPVSTPPGVPEEKAPLQPASPPSRYETGVQEEEALNESATEQNQ